MDLSKFKSLSKLNLSSYLINEDGDIYSLKSNKILSKSLDKDGYVHNSLYSDNKQIIDKRNHRLVGEMFLEKIEGKNIINHKDLNKLNNNYKNLEWCTTQENTQHAYDNGTFNRIKVICLNDNKIFDSIKEAGEFYNIHKGHISKVCRGTRKHNKGYIFKYYKELQ